MSGAGDLDARDPNLRDVIARVPLLATAEKLTADLLSGGLTNTNYLVVADGAEYVVRVSGPNAGVLGIDRQREARVLEVASMAGIAPEVVAFLLPEGHSVTRYLRAARAPSMDEFTSEAMVPRVAARLRDVHQLPAVAGAFDPYADIRRWLDIADTRGVARPRRLRGVLDRVDATERARSNALAAGTVLCHNDPYFRNFLDDGSLWLIDWEYAGMGDPMFDLAGVGYTLALDGKELLLASYFGGADQRLRLTLDRMIDVFLCWNVAWALLQAGDSVLDFDYAAFAEELIDLVPQAR